jgi:hypothetical protein
MEVWENRLFFGSEVPHSLLSCISIRCLVPIFLINSISNSSKMLKKSGLLGILILSSYFITTIPASAQLLKAPVVEDVTSLERKPNDESRKATANSLRQRLLESKQQQSQQPKQPQTVHRMETRWRKFKQELDVLFGL